MIRLGTDIVYIPQIQATIDRFGDRFSAGVHAAEQLWVREKNSQSPLYNQLAGRWAARSRCQGTGNRVAGCSYTDIEIDASPVGHQRSISTARRRQLWQFGEGQWQLSLSHDGSMRSPRRS